MSNPPSTLPSRLARPLLLAAGLTAAALILRALPPTTLPAAAKTLTLPAFIALSTAACTVGIPRQAIAFAAGYAHGPLWGTAAALTSQLTACALNYVWARLIAKSWLRPRLGPRLTRLTTPLTTHPFTATLTLRLLPIGNNLLLNLTAGALAIPTPQFLAASALGYLPQTIVFALLGAGIHLARGTELALAALTFAASVGLGVWLQRRG